MTGTLADTPRSGQPAAPRPAAERNGALDNHAAAPGRGDDWQWRLWRDLARRPLRSLAAALLVGAVVGVLSGILATRGAVTYTSQAAMLIDDPYSLATAADEGQIIKLSDLRFKYASLASTEVIAGPVASALNVPVGVVEGSTTVSAPSSSLLMYVSARWVTPGFAEQLATSVAQQISAYIQQEEATYNVPAASRYRAVVVNPASAAVGSGPSRSHAGLVGLGAAAGAAVVVFVLSQLVWEPRLRRRT